MKPPKKSHVVEAADELAESHKDAACLLSGVHESMVEMNNLYRHGYGGPGNGLVHLGVSLMMIPEPFMITDVVGGGVIASGLLYNRFVPQTLYIDDVFQTIQEQIKAIHIEGVDLSKNYSVPLDLSSIKLEI